MRATGWHNGKNGYGIRVGRENAQRYFSQDWKSIQVEIEGENHEFALAKTFWTTCPEFRGAAIGQWLARQGKHAWDKGRPPVIELSHVGECRFSIALAASEQATRAS